MCVCVVCIPLIPSQKSNGYDFLKIWLRNFCQHKDLEMSISENGPCSQVKHGKTIGGLWYLLTRGLFSRGDFERSLLGAGPCSGLSLGQV